ncbi:hypothetical protein E2P81_ATG08322 [Venturia nashicola]|nr:hypothetical protein E2P81_ATG08322 [Venturia nashicola]
MLLSSQPPYTVINLEDILKPPKTDTLGRPTKTNFAKTQFDPKPPCHHHTKPRQLIGRVCRSFVRDPPKRNGDGEREIKSKEGKCSWCNKRFYNRREFFEHGACRQHDDDESPTMQQAREWISEMEEGLNQVKRGARAATSGILKQFLRGQAAKKDKDLGNLLRAREQLKKDVQTFKKKDSKGLVKQCEKGFLRFYAPDQHIVGGMVREKTNLRRDRYLGWAVRVVEDGASRVMGKRCRMPYVHR